MRRGVCMRLYYIGKTIRLEIVKRKVELVHDEDQEQEGEDDDDTRVADVIGQQSVKPKTDGTAENGAFWCRGGDESEEQRHPYQAEECPFPNVPHLDSGGISETQADEAQQIDKEERANAERLFDERLRQKDA